MSNGHIEVICLVVIVFHLVVSLSGCDIRKPGAALPATDSPPITDAAPSLNPTTAPTLAASPTNSPSPVPSPTSTPTPEPTPHPAALFAPKSIEETDPSAPSFRFQFDIMAGGEIVSEYKRPDPVFFELPEDYTQMKGITTFRGNNFRNSASWGTVDATAKTLTKLWSINISAITTFTGVGWTGQPAIVQWDKETLRIMNIRPEKLAKEGLVEVIYAAQDGYIRFLDLDDGTPTRDSIRLGSPIKGSVTLDPRGYPLMFIGEGAFVGGALGFHIFSLIDGKELFFLNGADPFANRFWRSFDGNGLIDAKADTLVTPAENGILYTMKLNTEYDREAGTISVAPELVKYRYKTPLSPTLGIENSVVAFSHYAMFADNSGLVQCVDLNTMTPVWMRHCTDDTDASLLLDVERDGSVSMYTACSVDKQGSGGKCFIRKLNAETGGLIWEQSYPCAYDERINGGALASPIVGKGDIDGGVIFFIAKVQTGQGWGLLVNLDKETGEVIWERYIGSYGWSSPVDVYATDGKSYIIVCDASGNMILLEGKTGEILSRTSVNHNVEGSPAIFGNKVVVGTRGAQIFCIEIG